jgi:hypothetical protein
MQRPDPATTLDPEIVQALAAIQGFAPFESEVAARIAAGAAAAVRAVTAHADASLFEAEPVQFLAELERLAGDD